MIWLVVLVLGSNLKEFFLGGANVMNSRDTGPKAKNKEATGSTSILKGYKVGMFDPQGNGAGIGGGLNRKKK